MAQQILLNARFEQDFPRSPGSGTLLLLPPVELGQGIVHGLGAAVEIAALGRLGEPLQHIFDKSTFIRASFAFGDHIKGDADRAPQLHHRLIKVDGFTGSQRTGEFENCRPFQSSLSGLRDLSLVHKRDDLFGNVYR